MIGNSPNTLTVLGSRACDTGVSEGEWVGNRKTVGWECGINSNLCLCCWFGLVRWEKTTFALSFAYGFITHSLKCTSEPDSSNTTTLFLKFIDWSQILQHDVFYVFMLLDISTMFEVFVEVFFLIFLYSMSTSVEVLKPDLGSKKNYQQELNLGPLGC